MDKIVYCIRIVALWAVVFFSANRTTAQCSLVGGFSYVSQAFKHINPDTLFITNTATSGSGIAHITWQLDSYSNGWIGVRQDTLHTNPVFYVAGNNLYRLCQAVSDSAGCKDTTCQYIFLGDCALTASYNAVNTGSALLCYNTSTTPYPYTSYWAFNNGIPSTSTLTNPEVTYSIPGTYPICLTVQDLAGCVDSLCDSATLPLYCNAVLNHQQIGNTVTFYNNSYGGYDTATIYFSDGNYADIIDSVTYTYSLNGNYIVNIVIADSLLTCSDTSSGINIPITQVVNDTLCGIVYNDVNNNMVFDAGEVPAANVEVRINGISYYTDTAGFYMAIVGGGWHNVQSFPSGSFVQTTLPLITGVYTTNNQHICNIYIGIRDSICYVDAHFQVSYFNGSAIYQNQSYGNWPASYYWTFEGGDPDTSTHVNMAVTYAQDGNYETCLIAQVGSCSDTFCTIVTISVPCVAQLNYVRNGADIHFENNSTGNWTNATVYFGDGTSSTIVDTVTHNYSSNTVFDIMLVIGDSNGVCTDTFYDVLYIGTDTLCGLVFNDINANGQFDSGEPSLPNTIINIDGTNYITDSVGMYHAIVYSDGHIISVEPEIGWVQTLPSSTEYAIVTTGGNTVCGIDFGLHADTLILSGIVYIDANGNGLYDLAETRVPGVTVRITGALDNFTVNTDNAGRYEKVVNGGAYNISYTPPAGYVLTQPINPNTYSLNMHEADVSGLNFAIINNSAVITGKVFYDSNNDGVLTPGEPLLPHQLVKVGSITVATGIGGAWSAVVPVGTYALACTPGGVYAGYSTQPAYNVNASIVGATYGGNNFGITPGSFAGNLCVTIGTYTCVTAGFSAGYLLHVSNHAPLAIPGTLNFYYDNNLSYNHSNTNPTSTNTATRVVSWHLNTTPWGNHTVDAWLDCSQMATINTTVVNRIEFVPDSGYALSNVNCGRDTLEQEVRASWDPNDKQVSPLGIDTPGYIRNSQPLNYHIQFHNTGTGPAINVILRDTLKPELDINTFEMQSASHSYHLQMEGRVLTWIFSNIMLPPATENFDSAFGYVSFNILPAAGLVSGTAINNNASIYFDYNDMVLTNTTLNTIEYELAVNDVIGAGYNIVVQPNPLSNFTIIKISGAAPGGFELVVYDITGKEVVRQVTPDDKVMLMRNNLVAGVYTFTVKQNKQLIGKGKLVVE